jgi:NAD-reducing hydrogenase large subunit
MVFSEWRNILEIAEYFMDFFIEKGCGYCNLIVSTTNNNQAMNRAVTSVARKYLSGQDKITEGMLNKIEVAVRAYDPCLSCATHALGRMPLKVELFDAAGKKIDSAVRG